MTTSAPRARGPGAGPPAGPPAGAGQPAPEQPALGEPAASQTASGWSDSGQPEGGQSAAAGRPAGGQQPGQDPARPGSPRGWRSWGWPLAIVAVVIIGGVLTAVLSARSPAWPLDPSSTRPSGSHALADLLAARGVTVIRTDTAAGTVSAARAAPATVVVTSPWQLTHAQLATLAQTPAALVIVGPDQRVLNALAPAVTVAGYAPVLRTAPACGLTAARLAGTADLGGTLLRTRAAGASRCYPPAGAPPGWAALVRYPAGGRTITVLGAGTALTNGELAHRGNAALALNLLSSRGRLVWLVPGQAMPVPVPGPQRSGPGLIPGAALLVAAELAVAALLAALWRMRRFGPLVSEPIPVVVRASETTEGHARLYQSRHSRDRAAAQLRATALDRLLPWLGLPRGAQPAVVCGELTRRTGRATRQIEAILYGPVPPDDGALVRLAADLDTLEGEVLIP
jgi:hypothetical protein